MTDIPNPKKSLGQHWLSDRVVLNDICNLAEIKETETVLEIGPGYGTLTELLLAQAQNIIAVELDNLLANLLIDKFKDDSLRVINESILSFDLTSLPANYKLVANIPYYLTSNLLRLLSESENPPILIVLLVQKEVAERVCAKAGDMSILSITTQFYWDTSLERIVKAEMFTPPPKVDSQVILLKRRQSALFPGVDDNKFFRLVKIGFSARRKTLLNSLANGFRIGKDTVTTILSSAGIEPNLRPQMLSIDDWYKIYNVCLDKGIM